MPLTALERFTRLSDSVIKFEANFHTIREEEHHVYYFEVLNSELKMLWEKMKIAFDKCIDDLESSEDAEPEDIQVAESKFNSTMNIYARCSKLIKLKIDELEARSRPKESPTINNDTNHDNVSHNLPLPPCDTDIFSGDYLSWPTFRDLFTALYINNSRLSNIERLCYLVKRTDKEAREIVSKCPLTNLGFDIAWKSLKDTYENPRMLVNNQLKGLFGLETISKETSSSLKTLQRGINGFITAMAIYEISTQNWDPILVFICIQRLPSQTVTLWEQSIKDKTALSLWKDLDMFLSERIQTLDCIRDLTSSNVDKKGFERKVKAHVSNTGTQNACVVCHRQGHLLRFCRQFKKMSVSERYNVVKKHHCCVNCFAPSHEVRDCKSEHSCSVCRKRHHTLLHRENPVGNSASPPIANNSKVAIIGNTPELNLQEASTSATAPTNSNRQVFHILQNSSVLLGTAMVSVHSHDTTYPARALIDPASEASFISEHLRNQLRLPSHSTNVTISGVHKDASTTSRKCCSIRVGSPLDAGFNLEANAFVLPSISGNLPSFNCPSEIKGELPNIRLADRNFYKSRAVDLLLGADLYPRIILNEVRNNIVGSLMAQKTVFGWVLTGPVNISPKDSINVFSTTITHSEEDNLNENLTKFWELEQPPRRKVLSQSDKMCEEIYRKTTFRDSEGRYVVSLPFKPEFPQEINLGISRTGVLKHENQM
ncbi:uncharacterized protein LOC119616431 [Lucilia sericata]|uniref:uncharacterized protein LOC119616431 n=1 Tax=Lucilia sericata TaxID=13632 RepID=UPI0018A83DEF|nr:uncharacterized protein LOC119616431 [Lucilia sericata]